MNDLVLHIRSMYQCLLTLTMNRFITRIKMQLN